MSKKFVLGLAAGAMLAAASAIGVTPAIANSLTTSCKGEAGAVTVPGDLVVPADASCELTGTIIEGNVTVEANADLLLNGVTIKGNTKSAAGSYIDAADSKFNGTVTLTNGYGLYLENSQVGGQVLTEGIDGPRGGFVYSLESKYAGDLQSNFGELYVEGSEIKGNFSSIDSVYADVYRSWIDGSSLVQGSNDGAIFCETSVAKTAEFVNNVGPVQVGANGRAAACEGTSYWGGQVTIRGTAGESVVDNGIFNTNIHMAVNDPVTIFGENNRVRGVVSGSHTTDAPAPSQAQTMSAKKVQEDRRSALKAKADQRSAQGSADASAAGKAF